ncbi:DNA-dependent metalloprotease dvc-1-like [Uranotaenia lowii]|uniref:DNA-dependent metalloprotease dvc-1-like n=1 Tax=Uranotaenia lowii TaxID=190385 RepID=UPI00247A8000|nr:DNA-dependent metalloprotease dvc-1-like [Uranotaenia lowii]
MSVSDYLNNTQNLVHPDWEVIDPTPDIHVLFPIFDRKFFQGRLVCVQLEWSKKMYSCAGICYQRSNRMGMSCIIRLSEPLLKLRSRKDLVETLLHEMIHAYCFVLGIREGNGGHGPNFKKIMHGINKIAGTNITVYHTFHDEVNLYKTHWWKCNGQCRNRGPFYGTVKRTANRKPGPSDFWWAEHQRSCGGEFIKIKEPEPKRKKAIAKGGDKENKLEDSGIIVPSKSGRKTKSPVKPPQNNRISNYFNNSAGSGGVNSGVQGGNGFKKPYTGTVANAGGRTVVVRKPPSASVKKPQPETENRVPVKKPASVVPPGTNLKNVKQFKDLSGSDSESSPPKKPPVALFVGGGYTLGGSSGSQNRAGQVGNARNSRLLAQFASPAKKARVETTTTSTQAESIDLSDDTDYIFDQIDLNKIKQERQDAIKKEILESLADEDMEDIILIDDEYDDDAEDDDLVTVLNDSLTDTSVIDELFSANDSLIEDFNRTNAIIKAEREEDEIVSCPMCLKKIKRSSISPHLEQCYSIILGEESTDTESMDKHNRPSTSKGEPSRPESSSTAATERELNRQMLLDCGYSEADIVDALDALEQQESADISSNSQAAPAVAASQSSSEQRIETNGVYDLTLQDDDDGVPETLVEKCECPVCGRNVPFEQINVHLDQCLGS